MKRSQLERKPMKRSQPKRYWGEARAKLQLEYQTCRVCYREGRYDPAVDGPIEAAHVMGREHDKVTARIGAGGSIHQGAGLFVAPVRIVPLCRKHHRAYDAHELDLLPYLTVEEQAQAVLDAGGIELARNRICGGRDG